MHLIFFLLEEWNNSALALITGLFLFFTLLPFFLFWGILKVIPETNRLLLKWQTEHKFIYYMFLFLLLLVSGTLVLLVLNYINGG